MSEHTSPPPDNGASTRQRPAVSGIAETALAQAMQQAGAAYNRGDWAKAEQLCRAMLNAHPGHFGALNLLGIIAGQTGHLAEAAALLGRAVAANPQSAAAHNNHGSALQGLGRHTDALECFERALQIKPDYADAYYNCGLALQQLGRLDDALASYDRALTIKPDLAAAHYNRGLALQLLKRLDDALECYQRALTIKPDYAEAENNRGLVLQELKRFDQALASYDRALAIRPDHAEAHSNRGGALQQLHRLGEALESHERALNLKPDYAEAHNNRGVTLQELNRLDEALESYGRALTLKPGYAEAHLNRANALRNLGRLDQALESLQRALTINPDYVEAHINRGNVLQELQRFDEALECYELAMRIAPDHEWLHGLFLYAKMQLCDWRHVGAQIEDLAGKILRHDKAAPPFAVLALADSAALQRQAAETWVRDNHPRGGLAHAFVKRGRRETIRIGYYSADYHNHATAHLIAGLFESHDRERFELVAFSFGPESRDAMRQRVSAAFDRFIDVRTHSDEQVAQLSRELEIDIAVDLKGFTQHSRHGIFSCGAAPIQVSYLGYPGTLGAPHMDYLIADRVLIPEGSRRHYTEKLVYLPNSYQVNDHRRPIAHQELSRAALGLPTEGFVFCCFNNGYKITPGLFDAWMRILTRTESGVLWLLEDSRKAAENLRREAEARGVSASRLIFAPRMPLPEHLARHRAADLFLDTLPCNAHTTASDALWAGLPVLTCMGESFAARVAASLLNAVGLPDLITSTREHYETLAIELAANPERLAELRGRLNRNRLTAPLFDTELTTRHLENAYTQMYQRYQSDLSPAHIHVMQ